MRSLLLFTILLTLFASCSSDSSQDDIDTSNISLNLKVNRLEQDQKDLTDISKAHQFLRKYPSFTGMIMCIFLY